VSKGDTPLAEITRRELREMLSLRRQAAAGEWRTRVMVVSSPQMSGIAELIETIETHGRETGRGKRLQGRKVQAVEPSQEPAGDALDEQGWRDRIGSWAARDRYCALLGLSVLAGGPGSATVTMVVQTKHLNFNGACHGGAIFSLADAAFGLASNSHGLLALGINASATFQMAALEGDTLVARATEVHRGRRTGIYRVDVMRHGQDDAEPTLISTFTGTVYVKNTPVGDWNSTETKQ